MDMQVQTVTTANLINEDVMKDITGQLSEKSRRIYRNDAMVFATWIQEQGLIPAQLTRSDIITYRSYLIEQKKYQKATAQRMFSVANRILRESVIAGKLASNPADNVKGFKVND